MSVIVFRQSEGSRVNPEVQVTGRWSTLALKQELSTLLAEKFEV